MIDLQYRPNEFDDWGMIRNADGSLFAVVRRPASEEELAEHRRAGTDPYEDLARRLIASYDPTPGNQVMGSAQPPLAEAKLNRERAVTAAVEANNAYGQWMPEQWLHLFLNAYERLSR